MILRGMKILFMCGVMTVSAYAQDSLNLSVEDIKNFSVKDLKQLKVTSVSRKAESPFEAAAAIHVLTAEDIRRAGSTNVADALRMVPGVEVAQVDSNKWAISVRGFNDQYANKLLVMIDGRSVYTPHFSGVYWDVQDVVLEDVARIEVIRGPGAALWGSNAVNGVINIITKSAKNTQGHHFSAHVGNHEKGGEYRQGGKTDNGIFYRVYTKYNNRGETKRQDTLEDKNDDWDVGRAGFRADWDISDKNKLTVISDFYDGSESQLLTAVPGVVGVVDGEEEFTGGSLLTKWTHTASPESVFDLQVYFDYVKRDVRNILNRSRKTTDFDFQHTWSPENSHEIVWGLGYRFTTDEIEELEYDGTVYLDYLPNASDNNLFNGFIQDKIRLKDNLFLTLGARLEHHYYTGYEFQPNARVAWLPSEDQTVWASVARAVRTPTRSEYGLTSIAAQVGGFDFYQQGNDYFNSENLTAYEIGYRAQPARNLTLDATVFYNDYEDLITFEYDGAFTYNAANNGYGETYGFELGASYNVTRDWTLYANYALLEMHLHPKDVSNDTLFLEPRETRDSKHRASLMSRLNLPNNIELDNNLYYVSNLSSLDGGPGIPAYARFDTRVGWKPKKGLELSLVGQNLFDEHHPEFIEPLYSHRSEIGRSIYGKVAVDF